MGRLLYLRRADEYDSKARETNDFTEKRRLLDIAQAYRDASDYTCQNVARSPDKAAVRLDVMAERMVTQAGRRR